MEDAKSELSNKLVQWLETQGYPLEMTVANSLLKLGLKVSLSDYYTDSDTNELREIDITANRWAENVEGFEFQVAARIECKSSKDKPWVIFVPQDQNDNWFPPLCTIASDHYFYFWLKAFGRSKFEQSMREIDLFLPRCVGYGVTQAFTTGQDVAYKAIMGSVKACADIAEQFNKSFDTVVNDKHRNTLCVSFPFVVTDAKLFECTKDRITGRLSVDEVESSTVHWKGASTKFISPIVHIFTTSALNRLAEQFDNAARILVSSTIQNRDILDELIQERRRLLF